ncbi:MAG: trehalose-phosphatase, partial [Proteobacteria bacterium]|nr:trehalose-phosphatase [Pseudomonadota bacterium]
MTIQSLELVLPPPRPLRLAETALFLDLDGTLAPFAARPQDVGPDARRTDLLARLAERLDGRVAVVSGRPLADVDHILEGCVPCVAAVHGLVRRDVAGQVTQAQAHPAVARAAAALRAFAARDAGLIVEDKGGLSVALHFRQAR